MKNYLVKYKSYVLPSGKIFTIGGISIAFTKEKKIIDVYGELVRQTNLSEDNPKFKDKLNDVYATLIKDCKCEPYIDTNTAKVCMINARNDDFLAAMLLKKETGIENLRKELNSKLTNMRLSMEKEMEKLESKLQEDLQESIGEVNKEESLIFHAEKQMKNEELPIAEQIRLKEDIAQSQQRTQAYKNKLARQNSNIASKVEALRKAKEKDMRAVEIEYSQIISEYKKKSERDISDKANFLYKRKIDDIELVDKILNFVELVVAKPEKVDEKKPPKK